MKSKNDTTETPMPIDPAIVEKMQALAGWLHEKQARGLKALDVGGLCDIAEGVVIATAGSVRHAQALADHVLAMAGKVKSGYLGMEGYKAGTWVLMDMNDVLVHIFQETARGFYNIEGLWAEAREVPLDLPVDDAGGDDYDD